MLKVPSGFLYQPSNAGVTVWPEVFTAVNGNCARTGSPAPAKSSASPTPTTTRGLRIGDPRNCPRSRHYSEDSATITAEPPMKRRLLISLVLGAVVMPAMADEAT